MSRLYRSIRVYLNTMKSGQAAVEFAFCVTLILLFMCSAIDFGRALYDLQALAEITGKAQSGVTPETI